MRGVTGRGTTSPPLSHPSPRGTLLILCSYLHTALFTQAQEDSANYLCIIDELSISSGSRLHPAHSYLSLHLLLLASSFFLFLPHHRCFLSSQLSLGPFYKLQRPNLTETLLQINHQHSRSAAAFRGCSGSTPRGFQ